jgi:hypothetical protein
MLILSFKLSFVDKSSLVVGDEVIKFDNEVFVNEMT